MLLGVIDIGSNSVRSMLWQDGVTIKKEVVITRLGENLASDGVLCENAKKRTFAAVAALKNKLIEDGAQNICAFGTAAMRRAANGAAFGKELAEKLALPVEIVSGEEEAELGLIGALGGKDGGIIDIGGASSEISVSRGGKRIYGYSLDMGVVRLVDICGQDADKLRLVCAEAVQKYPAVPAARFYVIGGTATSLAAIDLALEPYDPKKVDGYKMSADRLSRLSEKLLSMSVEERKKLKGLQSGRAEVIAGGSVLLIAIMDKLKLEEITVSESDNLEGYALSRFKG